MGKLLFFFSKKTSPNKIKRKTKQVMLASLAGTNVVTTCCDQSSGNSCSQEPQQPTCVSINLIASDTTTASHQQEEPGTQPVNDDDEKSRKTAGNVRQVRLAFIGLVRFTRLQYFYLGALIYSVICTTLTLAAPTTCPSSSLTANLPLMMLLILPAILLLAFTIRSFLAGYEWACRWTRPIGLACALSLLELPVLTVALSSSQSFGCGQETSGFRLFVQTLIILYLVPLLFEGSRLGLVLGFAFTGLLSVLPAFSIQTSNSSMESSRAFKDYQLESEIQIASWILFSLIVGYLRRYQFTYLVGECAFSGADQLIEAKVGLEHQRQQQETLLLSVLPAYVAEQVKRNMVKKITTCSLQPAQGDSSSEAQLATPNSTPISVPIGTSASSSAVNPSDRLQPSNMSDSSSGRIVRSHSITGELKLHPNSNLLEPPNRHTSRNSFLSRASPSSSPHSGVSQSGQAQASSGTNGPQQLSIVGGHARRGFNELYIRTYNNVSLLYGDIVGFTKLCTQLSSSQLVRVLNDLFSHFDHLAERHRIMRIKILGDCYYGVAGIPEFAVTGSKSHKLSRQHHVDNHAINCVNMGLDMIHYIRRLNIERASQSSSSTTSSSDNNPVLQQLTLNGNSTGGNMPAFELNMRIGIHSGHIHSGVIGLKKWQFDVWSNDVSIAMHCESSGVAGRIQVTQATIQQLEGAFTYELAQGAQRDSFLAAKDIKTYLIRDKSYHINNCNLRALLPQPTTTIHTYNRASKSLQNQEQQKHQPTDEENIRAATIGTIRQTLLFGCEQATQPLSSDSTRELSFNWHDLHPFTLSFRDKTMDRLYKQRDTNALLYELLTTGSLLLLLIYNLPSLHSSSSSSGSSTRWLNLIVILLLALLLLLSIPEDDAIGGQRKATDWLLNKKALSSFCGRLKSIHSNLCKALKSGKISRTMRYFSSTLIALTVIMIECYSILHQCINRGRPAPNSIEQNQLTVILLLIYLDSSVNLLGYRTKVSLIISVLIVYFLPIIPSNIGQKIIDFIASNLLISRCPASHPAIQQPVLADWFTWALLFVMILWSILWAAQIEYANRTSFLWRNKLSVDHEELEYISGINKVLLENILPSHVVQHYLTQPSPNTDLHSMGQQQQQQQADEQQSGFSQQQLTASFANLQSYMRMSFSSSSNHELYHEQHESVAVMFASIPHFYEFYDESNISKQGLGCIALLNEIICDFDKLLLKNKFSRIEKIKTIGSTYMAAAGLRPNSLSGTRNSTVSQVSVSSTTCGSGAGSQQTTVGQPSPVSIGQRIRLDAPPASGCALEEQRKQVLSQQKLNLICMIQFASSLMSALNGINKQSFQVFKLRVGVNAGSVIAGVIGARRPFYDIWGDCVNIASRMESLGEVGRIQVEERTAILLMESLCTENYSIVRRGPIDVKGKGGMVTYFVDNKKENNSTLAVSSEQPVGINCAGKSQIGADSAHPHHQHLKKDDTDAINH